jgi:hypothetical protein
VGETWYKTLYGFRYEEQTKFWPRFLRGSYQKQKAMDAIRTENQEKGRPSMLSIYTILTHLQTNRSHNNIAFFKIFHF